jgi:hypothetical protein
MISEVAQQRESADRTMKSLCVEPSRFYSHWYKKGQRPL